MIRVELARSEELKKESVTIRSLICFYQDLY